MKTLATRMFEALDTGPKSKYEFAKLLGTDPETVQCAMPKLVWGDNRRVIKEGHNPVRLRKITPDWEYTVVELREERDEALRALGTAQTKLDVIQTKLDAAEAYIKMTMQMGQKLLS